MDTHADNLRHKHLIYITIRQILLSMTPVFLFAAGLLASNHALQEQLNRFSNDPALKHASWSFMLIDLATNTTILSHQPHLAITPASVQKLVTTAAALQIFGHDHLLHTSLQTDGPIDANGNLNGNLYIRGGGDPSLGSSFWHDTLTYERVAAKLHVFIQSLQIKHITGNIIADDGLFDSHMLPRKWLWEDMGNYFGAGASALSFNENTYTIHFDAGPAIGSPATIRSVVPQIPGMTLLNHVTTAEAGSGDQVYIYGAPHQNNRWLTGTVPLTARNFSVRGSMPDPALFTAQYLSQYLEQHHITVAGAPSRISDHPFATPDQRQTIGRLASPPLSALVCRTNMNSVNLYAENLIKLIGLQINNEASFQAGIDAIYDFWANRGMDLSGMKLHDGSGLSPSSKVTAKQIGFVLHDMWLHESFPHFLESFPLAGMSGSLANFFRNTPSEGVLRAKSGFLGNVRSYAGYTSTPGGKQLAFVLIVNNYEGTPASMRQKMFRLLDAITTHTP